MNPEYVVADFLFFFLNFSLLRDSFSGWWEKDCRAFRLSVIRLGF